MANNNCDFLGLSSSRAWETLASKERSVASIHFGKTDFKIGTTLQKIIEQSLILPPRTGHLADWRPISEQKSGAPDFNHVLSSNQWARPLLFGFTQTENIESEIGDQAYRPGCIYDGSKYTKLPLYTSRAGRFINLPPRESSFLPFTFAKYQGDLLPLSYIHKLRNDTHVPYQLDLEASEIIKSIQHLQINLNSLLNRAMKAANPRRSLQNYISHSVWLDGTMKRFEWGHSQAKEYTHLVSQIDVPLQALDQPMEFMQNRLPQLIRSEKTEIPLISHLFTSVLTALLNPQWKSDSIAVHLHWGARAMAGIPPLKSGYFMEKSTQKSLNEILNSLKEDQPESPSLLFGILPAAIFLLCPPLRNNEDCKLIEDLIQLILNESNQENWNHLIQNFWSNRRHQSSTYFRERFRPSPSTSDDYLLPTSQFSDPNGFSDLSFRQACTIVANITEMESRYAN